MKKNSITKNFIFNLIYQILSIILPLLTTPYLSRVLGAKSIGIYGYTVSIVTFFILFGSLGISMYGQREIAYYQNDKKKMSKTFWEIVIVRLITLMIAGCLFFFIYCFNNEYNLFYKILLIFLLANIFDISWFFQGIERFEKTVIRNLIVKVLGLLMIFIFVKNQNDLWKYFLIYSGSEMLGNISTWFYIPKFLIKIKLKDLNLKKHIKPILILFLPQIAIQIYTVLDKTMIGALTHNMVEVGYYEQAQKVVKTALFVSASFQTVMNSKIANAYAENDEERIKDCLEKSFLLIWLLDIPIMFGLIALAPSFVPWFYGDGFDGVINIIRVISPIILSISLNGVTGIEYLVQTKQQKPYTKSVIFGCIINVILNFILIKKFDGVGASISSVIAETFIFLFQLRIFVKKYKFSPILLKSIKSIIASLVMLFALLYIQKFLKIGIIYSILEVLIGSFIYFVILFILKDETFTRYWKKMLIFTKNILNIIYNKKREKL